MFRFHAAGAQFSPVIELGLAALKHAALQPDSGKGGGTPGGTLGGGTDGGGSSGGEGGEGGRDGASRMMTEANGSVIDTMGTPSETAAAEGSAAKALSAVIARACTYWWSEPMAEVMKTEPARVSRVTS